MKVAETTNTTVAKLGDSSVEIGKVIKVIKVITSIAQQTNLLALNAAIEAAKGSSEIAHSNSTLLRRGHYKHLVIIGSAGFRMQFRIHNS